MGFKPVTEAADSRKRVVGEHSNDSEARLIRTRGVVGRENVDMSKCRTYQENS